MRETLISFEDFSFTYQGQTAPTLRHLNFQIKAGEKVLVVGPSGSGKSTLGSCINALIPTALTGTLEGRATICSHDLATADIHQISKQVGTVLQDTDAQFVGLSVAEDIAFSLENQCFEQKMMHDRVCSMATVVGMEQFLEQSPQELSGGQKQRVSLAGVLVDEVQVLLFDEPLANLDPQTGHRAIALIDELQRTTDKAIIIIEHRLEEVLSCPVDRILVMNEGTLIADTTPQQLLSSSMLLQYGLRDPLYLAALRFAGCKTEGMDTSSVGSLDVSAIKDCLIAGFSLLTPSRKDEKRPVQLVLEDLSYSYDGKYQALSHFSATICQGEMVSILGKNGAGKSTLAQLLMGTLKQDDGHIHLEGTLLDGYSASQRSSLVGYVMQNPNHMISCDLVYDEVAFALRQAGYSEEETKARVMDVLGLCALKPYHAWPISALSYGQKKRVTIASILVMQPKILILDEPTAAQDYQRYTELMEFLVTLNKTEGITILFITHDMHLALEYTHRSLVLSDGMLLCDKPTSEVFSDEGLLKEANLKVTSLYTLAKRCGIADIPAFIETFVHFEQAGRPEGKPVSNLPSKHVSLPSLRVGKKKKGIQKEGKKFGFALTYENTDSFLHHLNGVTKLGVFALWIVFCLTTFDIRFLLPSAFLSTLLLLATKIPFKKFVPYIIAMCTVITLNALFIYLFSPDQGSRYLATRTVLFGPPSHPYALTAETLYYLLVVCLKYFSLFPMALIFVSVTHPSQFASSLNHIGFSYSISYAIALALRYLPEVTSSYRNILHAQMARGVDISSNVTLARRLASVGRILAPLVLSSLDRIEVITNAMVLRGFGRLKKRTWYRSQNLKAVDCLVLIFFVSLLALSLYTRLSLHVMFWTYR